MPYVLLKNAPAIKDRLAALARYLDLPKHTPEAVIDWVLGLRKQIGIPHTLKEIGFDTDAVAQAAPMAEIDPSTGGNPVPLKAADYERLYAAAIAGTL
jgi:alcohol dehydrogenase class IV